MIAKFDPLKGEIFQIIDEKGQVNPEHEPDLSAEILKNIYELMVMARAADIKAVKLQRQGRMGTYAPNLGQEGCQGYQGVEDGKGTEITWREQAREQEKAGDACRLAGATS